MASRPQVAQQAGRYQTVYKRLWRHPQFRRLPERAKIVTLYLLTGPQANRAGYFNLSTALAAEDLNLAEKTFLASLDAVCRAFDWVYDAAARVVWVRSWWRWNQPANRDVIKGALRDVLEVAPSPLLPQFCRHTETIAEPKRAAEFTALVAELVIDTTETPCEAPCDPPCETPCAHHIQDQVQEQVHTQEQDPAPAVSAALFARWWEAYPRKTKPKTARSAWNRLKPTPALVEQMLTTLAWQRRSIEWTKDSGQFCPYPATWLNAEQWNDDPSAYHFADAGRAAAGRPVAVAPSASGGVWVEDPHGKVKKFQCWHVPTCKEWDPCCALENAEEAAERAHADGPDVASAASRH